MPAPPLEESQYWSNIDLLFSEIEAVIAVFHTAEEINTLARNDPNVLRALNKDPLFWRIQVHALQTTLFITLGRIFDTGSDAITIQRVVRETRGHMEFFTRQALGARKAGSGPTPP